MQMSQADETGNDLELDDFESAADSDDGQSIDLDPGDSYTGYLTDVSLAAGNNGKIEIDGNEVWLNATLQRQLVETLLTGKPIAYVKLDEEASFVDDDGEEQTYYPREFRFMGEN